MAALNFTGSPHSAKQSEGEQVIQERRETPEMHCLPFLFFFPLLHGVWRGDRNYRFLALPNFPSPFLSLLLPADQIAQNPKTIVCPMIDVIDHNHFGYDAQAGDAMRGAFDWEMYYKRIPIPPELQGPDPSDPYQ